LFWFKTSGLALKSELNSETSALFAWLQGFGHRKTFTPVLDNRDTKAQTHCHCPEWHSRRESFGALGAGVAERNSFCYYYGEEKCFKAAILLYVLQKMAAQKLRICGDIFLVV
jgi:hypothetical protein